MNSYQIIVFENHDIYHEEMVYPENAVEQYINICEKYIPPEYVPQNNTRFDSESMFVKYNDRSGGDKPMMILMIGIFTREMINSIKQSLNNIYIKTCEECHKEIIFNMSLCRDCMNKIF